MASIGGGKLPDSLIGKRFQEKDDFRMSGLVWIFQAIRHQRDRHHEQPQDHHMMSKRNILLTSLAIAAFGLVACGGANTEQEAMERKVDDAMAEMTRDKDAALEELRDLRARMETRLTAIGNELEDPAITEEQRVELADEQVALEHQVDRVDAATHDVENAMQETWSEVKHTSKVVTQDIKEWLERQAGQVEKASDTDHDDSK
jgi:hypothetical protein